MHSVHRLLASCVVINYGFAFRSYAVSANYGRLSGREYETCKRGGFLLEFIICDANKILTEHLREEFNGCLCCIIISIDYSYIKLFCINLFIDPLLDHVFKFKGDLHLGVYLIETSSWVAGDYFAEADSRSLSK